MPIPGPRRRDLAQAATPRWPEVAIASADTRFRIAANDSHPAASNGNTGLRGAPTSRPSRRRPALTVFGSPPFKMNCSSGSCR